MARPYSLSRREITLVLCSVMIFLVFYNFDTTSNLLANPNLPGKSSNPTADGGLDMDIYGDWVSDERRISSVRKQQEEKEDGSQGNIWLKSDRVPEAQKQVIFGDIGVNDGFMHWGKDIPETRIVKHVAGMCTAIAYGSIADNIAYRATPVGFSIMDNVIMCNGTIFIVTGSPSSFPSLGSIASSADNSREAPLLGEWEILSIEQARDTLGSYGGL